MKISTSNIHGGMLSLRVAGTIALCVVIPLLAFATAPSWWSQRGVLIPNVQPDDYALANEGQLKNIARAAVDEMDVRLPGGAGNTLHDLVNAWATPNSQTNDFAPVNLGQAKNVAKPFYDRLIAVGLAGNYPWTANSSSVDDFGIANLGQIKSLFSFDVPDTMAAPPSNLTATATSSTTVLLSWILGTNSACTTIQASIEGGITWFVVGVVGPGVSTATITGLAPGTSVMFAVSSGGISSPGGGNTFTGPPVNGTGGGSLNPGAAAPAAVTPLGQPVLEGETVGYDLNKHGHKGFLTFSTNYYLTEIIVISTETENEGGNWTFFGSTTTGYTFDPITGNATAQPRQTVGAGGSPAELYGGPGRVTVSDTLEQIIGTGVPGEHARSTLTDTLSDIYSDDQLRSNVESRIPPFSPQFSGDDDWAYIYFDPTGYSYQVYKLQYRWKVNADPNLVVTWDVQFTPDDGGPVQHEFHRWVTGGETGDSGASYVVDPRFRNGGANGLYEVILLAAEPMVDGNRDGEMSFDDAAVHEADRTTSDKPYRFWLNDDDDTELGYGEDGSISPAESEKVPAPRPDHSLHQIVSKRNLEDFARSWINLDGLVGAITAGDIQVGLKWKNVTDGPAINIYPSADGDGSTSYLTDTTAAHNQITGVFNNAVVDKNNKQTLDTDGTFIFKADYWSDLTEYSPKKCLLFEGAGEGKGELEIVFFDQNNNEIGTGGSAWLDLKNVKKLYERANATPDPLTPLPYTSSNSTFDEEGINYAPDVSPRFEQTADEESQCLVFVHGWRMAYEDSIGFSETMFKRLWWQGYKGRFAAFRWGTLTSFNSYNTSEWLAWKYGKSLANYVENYLKHQMPSYTMNIAAHSMGNIVTGSALKRGMTVNTYMLMQSAVPSGCYDDRVNDYARFISEESIKPTPDTNLQKGYRLFLQPVASNVAKFVSFFNIDDYALATGTTTIGIWPFEFQTNWEKNQIDYKPDIFSVGYYSYDGVATSYFVSANSPDRAINDVHECLSFVARPRSKAAGAELHNATVFGSIMNLETSCNFGSDVNDHTGQFTRRIQELDPFYKRMFEELRQ